MTLPDWLALTVQPPTATSVSVLPLTVQTLGVVEEKLTAKPELALAASAGGAVPRVWLPGEVKVMVCAVSGAATTWKTCDTVGAARYALLPAWLALMLQLPTATNVSVLPLTVHTLGVVEAKLTARPELALATSAGGMVPRVWLPGEAKVMVCATGVAAATLKLRVTVVAGA